MPQAFEPDFPNFSAPCKVKFANKELCAIKDLQEFEKESETSMPHAFSTDLPDFLQKSNLPMQQRHKEFHAIKDSKELTRK